MKLWLVVMCIALMPTLAFAGPEKPYRCDEKDTGRSYLIYEKSNDLKELQSNGDETPLVSGDDALGLESGSFFGLGQSKTTTWVDVPGEVFQFFKGEGGPVLVHWNRTIPHATITHVSRCKTYKKP